MSPRKLRESGSGIRGAGFTIRGARSERPAFSDSGIAGNERTSVAAFFRRYCELSFWLCASVTSAIATAPRAAPGAACANHRARPPSRIDRPRPSVTVTCRRRPLLPLTAERWRAPLLSGSTVGFVRLDDLLHQRVPHHVFFVEVNERDALDVADDFHRLDQARLPRRRQVDLRN